MDYLTSVLLHMVLCTTLITNNVSTCPEQCICNRRAWHVACTQQSLQKVPSGVDNRTQILTLSHNNFQHLRPSSFNHALLHNLRTLDFSNNNISSIDPHTFRRIRNMQTLLLDHNNMKHFERTGSLILKP